MPVPTDQQENALQTLPQEPARGVLPIPLTLEAPLALPKAAPQLLGLPLQLLNQLLARLAALNLRSLAELLPALRLVAILAAAGFVVKLTGATLDALNDIPMLGRLLELVGLISALNFLGRNALKSQKRAELLARIQTLRKELLG
jgi:hypothetical protein